MYHQLKQVAAFLLVGGITAALYYSLIYILYGLLQVHYLTAVSVAYVPSVIFHFLVNRNVTFGEKHGDPKGQFIKYVFLAALNYVVNFAVVVVSVEYLVLNVYLGAALAIFATVTIGYFGMKRWVFSPAKERHAGVPPTSQ